MPLNIDDLTKTILTIQLEDRRDYINNSSDEVLTDPETFYGVVIQDNETRASKLEDIQNRINHLNPAVTDLGDTETLQHSFPYQKAREGVQNCLDILNQGVPDLSDASAYEAYVVTLANALQEGKRTVIQKAVNTPQYFNIKNRSGQGPLSDRQTQSIANQQNVTYTEMGDDPYYALVKSTIHKQAVAILTAFQNA